MLKKNNDQELMRLLEIDEKTLSRFREIQSQTIAEANAQLDKKTKTLKVLGISGSNRAELGLAQEKSNSETLLEVCLEECQALGAETELVPLRKYNIKPCNLCYSTVNTHCHFPCSCYPKGTPQSDDMSDVLYDKILEADAIIFATPVNNFNMSGLLKTFIDRCISLDGSLAPADPEHPKNKAMNLKHMRFIDKTADDTVPGSGLWRRFLGKTAGIIVTGHEAGASLTISSLFMTLNHFGMIFPPFSSMYAMADACKSTDADKPIVLSECYAGEAELLAANVMTTVKLVRKIKSDEWAYDYDAN